MCDPMVGMLVSAGSALVNYQQQSEVMSQQNQANEAWVAYQQQQQQKELAADEAARQKAESARQQSLSQINAQSQQQQQVTEQGRLTNYLTPKAIKQQDGSGGQGGADTIPGDLLLSGQAGATPEVKGQIASSLAQAASDARSRIAALATMQSYGGSQFGLGTVVPQELQASQQAIDLQSNVRRGNLAAYQVAKNVEPLKIVATPSPWGGIASSLAGAVGKGFGGGGGGSSF
jgi:hypothetical protein